MSRGALLAAVVALALAGCQRQDEANSGSEAQAGVDVAPGGLGPRADSSAQSPGEDGRFAAADGDHAWDTVLPADDASDADVGDDLGAGLADLDASEVSGWPDGDTVAITDAAPTGDSQTGGDAADDVDTSTGDLVVETLDAAPPPCDVTACDDANPCTVDDCGTAGATGCVHVALPDETTCAAGKWCVGGSCVVAMKCGNGQVEGTEACDDGNVVSGDGCSDTCAYEVPADMVVVPAGPFWMGHAPGVPSDATPTLPYDAHPGHFVWLSTYAIDKYELSQANYSACVAAKACESVSIPLVAPVPYVPAEWKGLQGPNLPMFNLSWGRASAYCKWMGKRLPTEAEWEKAARGGCEFAPPGECATKSRLYPWGDEPPTCKVASTATCAANGCTSVEEKSPESGCGQGLTVVGSFPLGASPYGALDMAGNVLEWVDDYLDYYTPGPVVDPVQTENKFFCTSPYKAPGFCPWNQGVMNLKVMRGGMSHGAGVSLSTWGRGAGSTWDMTESPFLFTLVKRGARCAKSLPSPKPPASFP